MEEIEERCAAFARRGQFVQAGESGEWPDGTMTAGYRFVHTLYQEVLYERLTVARRVRLHGGIGERIEQGYGTRASEVAVELAMHFERGRDYERAVRYLHVAGETAMRRHAHREAVAFFSKGLALLQTLPETPERLQQELTLHIALGPALIMTKGYADPAVEQVYTRARALCPQVGKPLQLVPALQGLWLFSFVRAEHQRAHTLGKQLLVLAQSNHDPILSVEAHQALGASLWLLGELAAAQAHVEQAIALYDPKQRRAFVFLYAHDSGVNSLSVSALALWLRGYPDQALAKLQAALALVQELSHPFSTAFTLYFAAWIYHCRRQRQEAQHWAEEAVAFSSKQEFSFWLAVSNIMRGAMLAQHGQSEAGIEQILRGLVVLRATGAEVMQTYFLALLAEAYEKAGHIEQGLAAVEEALVIVDRTGERFYEAELLRLKGALTLQSPTSHKPVRDKSRASQNKSGSRKSIIRNP